MDSSDKDGTGIGCAEALELVLDSELLDSAELSPGRRNALAAHLRTCANCAAQSRGLERALAALRATGSAQSVPAEASLDLWPSLRATLAAEGRLASPVELRGAAAPQRARWRWSRVASFASAAAVLAIALPLLWKQGAATSGGSSTTKTSPDATSPAALPTSGGNVASRTNATAVPEVPSELGASNGLGSELAADAAASNVPAAGKGGLRRALGEERRRDFAVPFEMTGENGAWSLASDRELR